MRKKSILHFAFCNLQFAIIVGTLYFFCNDASFGASPERSRAVPIEGAPLDGQLLRLDAAGSLVLQGEKGNRTLPLSNLVAWGACRPLRRGPVLVLADGGLLTADVLETDKDSLQADSIRFGQLKIPLEILAGVLFRLPNATAERDALAERILLAEGNADRLLLENGDTLSGTWESFRKDTVHWRSEVGADSVEVARLSAVVLNPALRRKPVEKPLAWVGFDDGSRLLVTRLGVEAGVVRLVAFGQTWKTASKHVTFLQPLSGRAAYLSDRRPSGYRFVPYLSVNWPYRRDRNVGGGFLRNGGRLYLKGLGVHSAARLSYALEENAQKFQAELALDDSAQGGGSVRFRVLLDGREKFTSPILRGNQPPAPISVDVRGAKRLDLVVDYADRGDVQDHADWLNARLIRK